MFFLCAFILLRGMADLDCTICNYAAGEIRYLTRHMGTHHFDVVACNMGVGDKHHSDALPGTVHCNM